MQVAREHIAQPLHWRHKEFQQIALCEGKKLRNQVECGRHGGGLRGIFSARGGNPNDDAGDQHVYALTLSGAHYGLLKAAWTYQSCLRLTLQFEAFD